MPRLDYSQVRKMLNRQGLSWTEPRKAVFKALANDSPQSITSLVSRLQSKVDRVSIYRTVDLFERLGIVHKINVGWKYKIELSDQFIAHHHHLTCLKCGQVIDIEDEEHIDNFIKEVSDRFNFKVSSHQFEIEGVCSDCQSK